MNTVIHYRDIFFKYFHLVDDMTHKELEDLKIQFGENLKRIRKAKKLSLLKLSYNCDLDDSNISKIEHGKFNITLATIIELAKGLEVHPKKLLDFEFE